MIKLQQDTIYMGTASPASGGGGSGDAVWGSITGTLSNQTDLQTALNAKQDTLTAGSGIDITNDVISATISGLQNTATGSGSLTILGTASSAMHGTNVGVGSQAGEFGATAFGNNAKATKNGTLALGGLAEATDIQAYQIGWGTNDERKTLYVGWGTNDNYKLLDGTTGKIPNDRLNAFTGATSSVAGSAGAVPAPTTSDVDKYLKGDGTWSTVSGGGSVSYDNSTINENASNELQAIGVKEARTDTAIRIWNGSQNQWQNYSPITFYNYASGGIPAFVSGDSIQWSSSIRNLAVLTYGAGKFIAIHWSGEEYYSTDGHTWVKNSTDFPQSSFFYGRTSFVNNRIYINNYYSTDGLTWNSVSGLDFGNSPSEVVYDGEKYVCILSRTVYTSSDGDSFTSTSASLSDLYECGLVYGNGKFIAYSSRSVYVSDDAENWSSVNVGINLSATEGNVPICYGNGKFIAVSGTQFAYSTDGLTWTIGNLPSSASKIAYGNGAFCTGNLYSTDGINWIQINEPVSGLLTYGDNKFVEVSQSTGTASTAYLEVGATASYYTEEYPATTSSVVYSDPEVVSGLTITSVNGDDITLSDGNVYSYLSSGNINTYRTVAQIHPEWLCNIENVGVKIGTTDIANLVTYSAFGGATGSVAGSAGLVPAPAATDNDKYLKGDGTWAAVSGATGSFTSQDGKTVTVTNGVITSIV